EDRMGYEEEAARVGFEIRFGPAIRALAEATAGGMDRGDAAARFHATVVAAISAGAERARRERGLRIVALSGGTFQNGIVLEGAIDTLAAAGFDVRINERVSPNDGGIALGQAAVAARTDVVESNDR
ncbi:MAG TPA: carbamoyltransferase HypF, partial [Gemmatimonadota bacterium]|nr:carbamoyltransferase HypF [Gemmatimonadota bacterium]